MTAVMDLIVAVGGPVNPVPKKRRKQRLRRHRWSSPSHFSATEKQMQQSHAIPVKELKATICAILGKCAKIANPVSKENPVNSVSLVSKGNPADQENSAILQWHVNPVKVLSPASNANPE
jgi:hypothetical protein